jgi:two-component system sensor histidine kinase/response regulator
LRSYAWWVSGYLHRCHQRYPEAIHALKHAIAVAGDKGYIYTPLRAMAELIEIYGEIGHWELGFKEQQRYLEMYARAQGLATRVHVQTLHIRHELQEAELARRLAEEAVVQRKALDDQLQRILAERETILENSIVGMLFLDNHGRIKWANTPLCQLFGFERDVVLGSSLEQFYPSRENFLQCASAVSAAVWRGESFDSEIQMRRADGSLFWVHFSGRAVDQTRPALGTVWVVMDITLRRQLEINLSVSEQRYKQVVENASEGIVVLQHGKAVFFNSRICQLFGRDSGALRSVFFSFAECGLACRF